MKKITGWKTKGMNRDISVSAFNNEFSFENVNLRIMTNEGNTALSWVNEKGTAQIRLVDGNGNPVTNNTITGTPIGTAVLNRTLVLFTTGNRSETHTASKNDRIYKLSYTDTDASKTTMKVVLLFQGNLNFSTLYPLETMVSYEAEHIQKVYWVDGRNQPRIINVATANETKLSQWNTISIDSGTPAATIMTFFDFVPSTKLRENVTITRDNSGGEMFAPGVIQYCFTYVNKYGQQTNIAWTSPLYYLTHNDRGASPEEEVVNSFKINITGADTAFDYLRLYSIQRTSIDNVPIVKMLDDIPVKVDPISGNPVPIVYTDNGTTGYAMDPTELLYVGGRNIIANTIADKDNTLFIGNFSQENTSLNNLQSYFDGIRETTTILFKDTEKSIPYGNLYGMSNDMYINNHTLTLGSKRDITTFKGGEWYRFGFQLQKNTGEWTEAIFIKDEENTVYPSTVIEAAPGIAEGGVVKAKLVHAQLVLNLSAINTALYGSGVTLNNGLRANYKKIRPVVVYPTVGERTVLCQGVVNPTVFNISDRIDNSPFAQSSWYFRPYMISLLKQENEEDPTVVSAELVSGGSYQSAETYNAAHPPFPSSTSNTVKYYPVICNMTKDNVKNILERGYITYRYINYDEYRYDDGPVYVAHSSAGGTTHYDKTPWDGQIEIYGAFFIGTGVLPAASGSLVPPFGGTAYLLLLESPLITPYWTPETEYDYYSAGRDGLYHGERFHLEAVEYKYDIDLASFNNTPSENMKNYLPTMYKGLQKEGGLLYYINPTGDEAYNNYTFQVFYEKNNGAAYTIQFTLTSTAEGYIVIRNNTTGNGVEYGHYKSLPTQAGLEGIKATQDKMTSVEIQGSLSRYSTIYGSRIANPNLDTASQFVVDQSIITMHSPDIEFDSEVQNYATNNLKMRIVGIVPITSNASAHRMTTSSAQLETNHNIDDSNVTKHYGSRETKDNVVHKNIDTHAGQRLVAEYLWNDSYVVQDVSYEDKIATAESTNTFLVFPWHRQGSLNNDPRTEEEASSWLKTKKESNILYSLYSNYFKYDQSVPNTHDIIDTQEEDHTYSAYKYSDISTQMHLTENDFIHVMKLPRQKDTASEVTYYPNIDKVLYNQNGYEAFYTGTIPALKVNQRTPVLNSPVSMKYKSTSHAVIALNGDNNIPILPYGKYTKNSTSLNVGEYADPVPLSAHTTVWGDTGITFTQRGLDERYLFLGDSETENNFLWLAELYKDVDNRFGGDGEYAIKNNKWIPCGEAAAIPSSATTMTLKWTDGDTYYQRYDNLKTYAYTEEDQNQLVEILSFMCETHVNIDGRYDRNRGQMDNTLMRPGIFNLLNPVYSQSDNFFIQKGIITDSRDSLTYPNQVTYSKTKISGADVDLWTNVTLASALELDGDKGKLNKLIKFNDQLIAFQDTGISQILYNENVQIASTTGVPIEIANSGKVQGKRYITDTIGCTNKWSIISSPYGIYFMDSHDRSMYMLASNMQVQNISVQGGMNAWSKNNIPGPETTWDAYTSNANFRGFYDKINQEVMFANSSTALAWSEKVTAFTSFYNYENTPFFNNLDDTGVWIRKSSTNTTIWKHNAGAYCTFFGTNKPYSMTLIGNPEPQTDKIFTNLEIAANVTGEGTVSGSAFTPYLPFDSLETWNEYQHGITSFGNLTSHNAMQHFRAGTNSLKRKFRLWRCDIPRDNATVNADTEAPMGIKRFAVHPVDRMRNPWLYLKLKKNAAGNSAVLPKTEIHDIIMTYFS